MRQSKPKPTATISRMKGGDWIVTLPDGRAVLARNADDARQVAYVYGGALLIRWQIPAGDIPRKPFP